MNVKNAFFSLTALKAVDFLFPLLLIPLAIKYIGIEKFGIVAYFQTISLFVLTLIDYGFNVVGIQRISVLKIDIIEKSYVSAALVVKLLLLIPASILYVIIVYLSPFNNELHIGLAFYIVVVSGTFNFQWFYQAKHKYRFILFSSFLSRLIAFAFFIFFINSPDDYCYYAFVFSFMYMLPSLIHFSERLYHKGFRRPSYKYIRLVFLSNCNVFIYRVMNAAVLPTYIYTLGFLLSPVQLGAMGVVQRFFGAVVNFSTPLTQALIPFLSRLKFQDEKYYRVKLTEYSKYLFWISLSLVLFVFSVLYIFFKLELISGNFALYDILYPSVIILSLTPHIMNSLYSQSLVLLNMGEVVKRCVANSVLFSLPFFIFSVLISPDFLLFVYVGTYWLMMLLMVREIKC